MTPTVVDQRILIRTAATLSWQGVDSDGEVADPGTVTVTVTDSDGTALATDAATSGSGTSARTYSLTAANNQSVDLLTATWKVSGTTVGVTKIAAVGAVYASVSAIRAREPRIADVSAYPTAAVTAARARVETMFEDACGVAFVPRFEVERFIGSGRTTKTLAWPRLRELRWGRVYDSDGTTYTALTAAELAAIPANTAGIAERVDGNVWPAGRLIEVGYAHGYDALPADGLPHVARCVSVDLNQPASAIPDRAVSFQPAEGGNVILATPGVRDWVTGIPSVDEWLMRHDERVPGVA